ncbi:hypothetical protein CES85_3731 (plasmid) [Ochrobactrum quorumnocens]|uniref:Uncharacterized protein n=1 Tax=Ochrobactrum quorumnocens TaxID=271865 RepID=A0A248UNX5_9HYPH|nr:hypothetical protein CES85_3731 [[Ochrobactrum] quorumnocens]
MIPLDMQRPANTFRSVHKLWSQLKQMAAGFFVEQRTFGLLTLVGE